MAIAYVNQTTDSDSAGATTASFSHDSSTADTLVVIASGLNSSGQSTVADAATYDSTSMTSQVSGVRAGNSVNIFTLVNPSSGSNTVEVTFPAVTQAYYVTAIGYSGVDQTTPTGVTFSGTSGSESAAVSDTQTTTADNSLVVIGAAMEDGTNGTPISPDNSETERVDDTTGTDTQTDLCVWVAELAVATAASTTVGCTFGSNDFSRLCAVELLEQAVSASRRVLII